MSTPMQEQYSRLKAEQPGAVMLFRMGDFYEAFDDDAKVISKVLGITLTGRGKDERRQPMAGIPHHALYNYLPKLVAAGHKVAIADQMHEPIPGKLVEREITEVVSPGVITDQELLKSPEHNYLAIVGLISARKTLSALVCMLDVSTAGAEVWQLEVQGEDFAPLLQSILKYSPKELVINESAQQKFPAVFTKAGLTGVQLLTVIPDMDFDAKEGLTELREAYGLNSLKSWGIGNDSPLLGVVNAARRYLSENLKKQLNLSALNIVSTQKFVHIPLNAYRSLEVFQDSTGGREYSLYNHLDRTYTAGGKRLLQAWLLQVEKNLTVIGARQDSVAEALAAAEGLEAAVGSFLQEQIDYDRLLTRLAYGKLKPNDLYGLGASLNALAKFKQENSAPSKSQTALGKLLNFELTELAKLGDELVCSIMPGMNDLSAPGFINPDCDAQLGDIVNEANGGKEFLKGLEAREVERSGIPSLKVKYNKVFGYYIEISKSNLSKVPADYIRKQTLVNAERFITEELKVWEEKILHNSERRHARELEVFRGLVGKVEPLQQSLRALGVILAELDVLWGFARLAKQFNYVRPEFQQEKSEIQVSGLRHPVVAAKLGSAFIANEVDLQASSNFMLLTGPNMAGKSTYIRSVAICQLLAQIGCYVPATAAKLPLADGVFTRVGAADNLSQNESTFMVEMTETAYILKHATEKSLIILDEVGRGTSTYDGVALAWAIVEYISQKLKCICLFATHYHELTVLPKQLSGVVNYYVEAKAGKELLFTHKVKPGALNKSFGVAVAKLAGVENQIVERANSVLKVLESENDIKHAAKARLNYAQLNLLDSQAPTAQPLEHEVEVQIQEVVKDHPVVEKLAELDLNNLTPMQALQKLEELKSDL
jgi:DNA mismatch repair protein MutS